MTALQPSDAASVPQGQAEWHPLPAEPLPRPTYWPAALAFGITLLFWGLVTTLIISGIGLIVFTASLAGWIGELRHAE